MNVLSNKKISVQSAAEMTSRDVFATGRSTKFQMTCYDKDGNLKWEETFYNTVVTAGLNDSLDKHLKGSSYTAAWYIGLTDSTPTVNAADTASSHAGWSEVTAYSESTRPALTLGTVASGSVDNNANKASFTINASTTVGGAFIISDNTKGGTTGVLYGVAALSGGDRSGLQSGDTLNVEATLTASAL